MIKKLIIVLIHGFLLLGIVGLAQALTITYTDQGTFLAANGNVTLEDFESAPWPPAGGKPQPLVVSGITWTANNSLDVSTSVSSSSSNSITSQDPFTGGDLADLITATFSSNVFAVGANIGMYDQDHSVDMTIFDSLDANLGSYTLSAVSGFNAYGFVGFASDSAIAKVQFLTTNFTGSADDFWVDDFYSTTPVPEPATMLLLGTGLVGVAGAARRRKKNQA